MKTKTKARTRAQESTAAIERMYITMRHLLNRGFYKPMGVSGDTLRASLLQLRPEIYGSIAEDKTELQGLVYVLDRLPFGIEQCRFINLTSDEGYVGSTFKAIVPLRRRRNCYRIDAEQMNIEITRGRSDIYDVLTHLTFLFIESHKIAKRVLEDEDLGLSRDWQKLEQAATQKQIRPLEIEIALVHVASILGRTFQEVLDMHLHFSDKKHPHRFLEIIYWLGKLAIEEITTKQKRTVTFTPVLRERLGHHIHGERWANTVKSVLLEKNLIKRPIHIISANMHSVLNSIYAKSVLEQQNTDSPFALYEALSLKQNQDLREKVTQYALKKGMYFIADTSGTNIGVQLIDTAFFSELEFGFSGIKHLDVSEKPVLIVMDYAFGEQAYETMDELLKPYKTKDKMYYLDVVSISIMGKAGILEGKKGDIMLPNAHIFEGTADNYPLDNALLTSCFDTAGLSLYKGAMVTVLGTSLQNKEVLSFFQRSTWNVIGLEMEGAHYQKAIQAASKIRKSISEHVRVRYAYYASDNPLETGSTLASGGLGTTGVKPTYLITENILKQLFNI